jgi:ATP synthase I chain
MSSLEPSSESPESTSATPAPATERLLDRALPRIRRFMLALIAIGLLVCVMFFRWQVTAGFAIGAAITYFNQRWLERAIDAMGERITTGQSRERGGIIVLRAVLRYILIAAGAYVIFNISLAALYGFLGGVCLTIAAVACEVAVELFVILRRGV